MQLSEVGVGHGAHVPLLILYQPVVEVLAEVWLVDVSRWSHGNHWWDHAPCYRGAKGSDVSNETTQIVPLYRNMHWMEG